MTVTDQDASTRCPGARSAVTGRPRRPCVLCDRRLPGDGQVGVLDAPPIDASGLTCGQRLPALENDPSSLDAQASILRSAPAHTGEGRASST